MKIVPFYEQETGTWCYLLADEDSGKAAIIDPVWVYNPVSGCADRGFVDGVLEQARQLGCTVEWVLETHAHADHLSAGSVIRETCGARIGIGRGICSVQASFARVYNLPDLPTDGRQFDRLLDEGDVIRLGSREIRVMNTPGHTDDSVTYLVGNAAFIGDTLFAPGFGSARCDFPGGSAAALFDSIQKIYALPDDTQLYLCHDYPAEGHEPRAMVPLRESRQQNIHVRQDTERQTYIEMREARDAQLGLPKLILPALQVNVLAGAAPAPERNGFSYLKIPFNTTLKQLLGQED